MAIFQDVEDVLGHEELLPHRLTLPMLQPAAAPASSLSEFVRRYSIPTAIAPGFINATKYVVLASRSMPVVVPVIVVPLWLSVSVPRLPPGLLSVPDDSMRTSTPEVLSVPVPVTGNVTLVSL